MKILFYIIFLTTITKTFGQVDYLYYKTVNSNKTSDSIKDNLIKNKINFIEYYKPCYWQTLDSLTIDYCNSHIIQFEMHDSLSMIQTYFITEYFTYHNKEKHSETYNYFDLNLKDLLQTSIRPDETDYIVFLDTLLAKRLKIEISEPLSLKDSILLTHILYRRESRADGLPFEYITLFNGDSIVKLHIDPYLFFPDNEFYKYNCKLSIYTMRILLNYKFETLKTITDSYLKDERKGLLNSLGQFSVENNPKYFEKIFEDQINHWIRQADIYLGIKNWKLTK